MESEQLLQQKCVMWFNNTYPQYRGLLAYNLNNSIGGYRGKQNKWMGIIKGRSDLVLYFGGTATMIELKTLTGTQKPEQIKWQLLVESQGFRYEVVRTLEEFKELVKNIVPL